jgi:hypothetical protein
VLTSTLLKVQEAQTKEEFVDHCLLMNWGTQQLLQAIGATPGGSYAARAATFNNTGRPANFDAAVTTARSHVDGIQAANKISQQQQMETSAAEAAALAAARIEAISVQIKKADVSSLSVSCVMCHVSYVMCHVLCSSSVLV